jgi:cysteine-rich repeat protein
VTRTPYALSTTLIAGFGCSVSLGTITSEEQTSSASATTATASTSATSTTDTEDISSSTTSVEPTTENSPGSTEASGSDTTMTVTPPECGNGLQETGEQCDDGNLDDTDACLATCLAASCGDGYTWSGFEYCDDGNEIETDTCDSACNPVVHRKVFVSSATFTGALGGLSGADAKCQALAASAGLTGTFKAWLSDDTTSPSKRFDTSFTGVYELVDGTLVEHGWAGLTDWSLVSYLEHGIDRTESNAVTGGTVWTGTLGGGEGWAGQNCKNWTSKAPEDDGSYGDVGDDGLDWTDTLHTFPCSDLYRFYCFEDPL